MADLTVSNDIDNFMQSGNKAAARAALGATLTGQAAITAADAAALRDLADAASSAQGTLANQNDARFKAIFRADNSRIKDALNAVNAGTRKSITNLMIGDSLANKVAEVIDYDHFRKWFPLATTPIVNDIGGGLTSGAIGGQLYSSGGTLLEKVDYDISFTGSHLTLTATESVIWSYTSVFATSSDRLIIPLVIDATAGSVKIQVTEDTHAGVANGAADPSWSDPLPADVESGHTLTGSELIVDASAGTAGNLNIVILSYDTTKIRAIKVSHESGGDVRMLVPMFQVLQSEAVNSYRLLAGSNNGTAATAASAVPMGQLIAALDPDLITFQEDDPASSVENFAPILNSAIVNAAQDHTPSVFLIGNGPRISSDMVAQNLAYYEQAAAYKWFSYGGTEIVETKEEIESYGWGGSSNTDFIHLSSEFYKVFADQMAALANFTPPAVDTSSYVLASELRDTVWGYQKSQIDVPIWSDTIMDHAVTGTGLITNPYGFGASMRVTNAGVGTARIISKLTNNNGTIWNGVGSNSVDFAKPFKMAVKLRVNGIASAGGTNKVRIKFGETADAVGDLTATDEAIALYVDEAGLLSFAYANNTTPVVTSTGETVLSASMDNLLEVHGDGAGGYTIYFNGTQVLAVTGGPNSSATPSRFIWENDCPTAPTAAADTTMVRMPKIVFFD